MLNLCICLFLLFVESCAYVYLTTDGQGCWDNNDNNDFEVPVLKKEKNQRPARKIESIDEFDHAGGKLQLIKLSNRAGATAKSRWTGRTDDPGKNFFPPFFPPISLSLSLSLSLSRAHTHTREESSRLNLFSLVGDAMSRRGEDAESLAPSRL